MSLNLHPFFQRFRTYTARNRLYLVKNIDLDGRKLIFTVAVRNFRKKRPKFHEKHPKFFSENILSEIHSSEIFAFYVSGLLS